MNGSLLVVAFCASIIVIGALVALVIILMSPQKNQIKASTDIVRRPRKDSKAWILFIGIALVLVIWSFWIPIFFLAVVGIMRLDPKPHQKEIPYPSDLDRDSVKGIYTWLLLSPFLTVPTMLIAALTLNSNSSTNERVFAALIPILFHLPLLFLLDSKRPFVYRHTQQAIFLVALRAGMASLALSIGKYPGDGAWLFFLGNGTLWLFGSFWARGQAVHREGWWIKRKGETILPLETKTVEKPITTNEPQRPFAPTIKKNKPALEQSLHTFRTGTPDERKKALLALSQLGEVEKF